MKENVRSTVIVDRSNRLLIFTALGFCIGFVIFVWFYEDLTRSAMDRRTDQYGQLLERPLQQVDGSGMQQDLQLIIRSGEYRSLAVLDLDGRLLSRAEGGLDRGYLARVLSAVGLIKEVSISRPILSAGVAIGHLEAIWLNKNIYVYLYFIPFLALLLKVMHYYMRQTFIQHDLERQVAVQTAELLESNTLLKKQAAEREQTQQEMIRIERLGALGQMSSGIAHDFNNLLSIILGYCELLLSDDESIENKATVGSYLDIIKTAAQDAAEVVRRLRGFYRFRADDEQFQPVDLNQLAEQIVTLTQPKWGEQARASGRTIQLEIDLAEDLEPIKGNETELRELLTNLIFNAVDATPGDGTITLRTSAEEDRVLLEIIDTGTGMTEEVRQRCMEPFFSTKGEQGTGLGLGLVHGIIRRHEGSIELDTELGKGTHFSIRLPKEKAQLGAAASWGAVTDSFVRPALHVLVVDDEPSFCSLVRGFLEGDGHTVETANDGRAGVQSFLGGRFDVVLLDQAMPEMNGSQVAAAIKEMTPNKPVVLVTGFGDMMQAVEEKPEGVDLILSKPVTLDQFREALAEVTKAVN